MICSKCNSINEPDSVFCAQCGNKLKAPESQIIEVRVGKADDNDIVIKNRYISSYHCKFIIDGDNIKVFDLNSTNGVYVNGKKVSISVIDPKDKVNLSLHSQFDLKELDRFRKKEQISPQIIPIIPKPDKSVIRIGRSSANDIVLDNVKVSRFHAIIENIDGKWFIEDLDSLNHSFVNGKKIKRIQINLNDLITIGGIPFTLNSILNESKEIKGDVSISVKNLSFIVENKVIVDDISLTIFPGEFIGLIGPSGSGKTSLMLMMCGSVKPTYGEVYINSQSLFSNYDSFKGQIGYVPQDDIIHRELLVEESFYYTAKLRFNKTNTDEEINNQVNKVIDTLDLQEAKKTLIGTAEKQE